MPISDLTYISIDEKLENPQSPWARQVSVAIELHRAANDATVWLVITDPITQADVSYALRATYAGDANIKTPDWRGGVRPYPGLRFALTYPTSPPQTLPEGIFVSSVVDDTYGVFLIGFFTQQYGWQHASPARRGTRAALTRQLPQDNAANFGANAQSYGDGRGDREEVDMVSSSAKY